MVHPGRLHTLGYTLLVVGIATVWPIFTSWHELNGIGLDVEFDSKLAACLFAAGVLIAVMYTAPPLRLKYNALGDVAVFVCFGPILMHFIAVILTGQMQQSINIFTIPVGLLTVAILHGNNTRDIQNDKSAGITTLAVVVGFSICRALYFFMIATSYISTFYIAYDQSLRGLFVVLLSLPIAAELCKNFKPESVVNADEETAKFHMVFGILMTIGIRASPSVESMIEKIYVNKA